MSIHRLATLVEVKSENRRRGKHFFLRERERERERKEKKWRKRE